MTNLILQYAQNSIIISALVLMNIVSFGWDAWTAIVDTPASLGCRSIWNRS